MNFKGDYQLFVKILSFNSYIHLEANFLSSFFHSPPFSSAHLCGDLRLDERQRLRAVLVDVLLVRVCVVSIAAVGVGGVTVALDDAGAGRGALEALRAGGETLGGAGADVVGETGAVVGVAHEDGGLDGGEGVAAEGGAGTAAEGVVHDLSSLFT